MPCNTNSLNRFFGSSGSSNNCWLGSSVDKENRWSKCATKKIGTYQFFPKRERHETKIETAGVWSVPFSSLSSVFHDAILRNIPDNVTPEIRGVDPLTLLPTVPATGYNVTGDAGTTLVPVSGALINVDSEIHIQVPRCACSGVVVDLGELSTFANSVYQNQVSTTRDPLLPGRGAHPVAGGAVGPTPALPAQLGVASGFQFLSAEGGASDTAAFATADLGYDALRLMHVPEVTIFNDSIHTVFIVDGFRGKTTDGSSTTSGSCGTGLCGSNDGALTRRVHYKFEGIKDTINCKPRESLCLVFLPDKGQWRVKDTNCRA